GRRPVIEQHLGGAPDERLALLHELVHTDLEYRLRAGDRGCVEDYLRRFPGLRAPREALELLAAECRHRWHLGERAAAHEYVARFPDYRDLLLQTPVGDAGA